MTREEREDAKDIIQSILDKYEEDECLVTEITIGDEDIKAFKMAIKALKQEPTTKNDLGVDCIDRAELLKAMNTWDKFGYTETGCFVREPKGNYVPYVHYEDMVNCVKGMASVTPQDPRKGHWIPTGAYYTGAYGSIDYVECSCCHYESLEEGDFCPNCGARMIEPQESEG